MVDGVHGVFLVAELRQDGLAGFDIQVERLADDFSAPDAHGSNLDDVVGEDIQAGCLGVEYDDFFLIIGLEERRRIAAPGIEQEVGRRQCQLSQLPVEPPGQRMGGEGTHPFHDACPGNGVVLVGKYA